MATQGQLSNRTLGNKYRLSELLGYGGFGEVYKAQNILLNRPQAIKVILEKHLSNPKFRERFLREAQTLAALDHPNIVHIDDFELEQDRAYLVMPFISGGTLHTIMAQRGRLSLEETIAYLRQICAALDYAHSRNVVHLDLKPHNFLHQKGVLLLSDFGLAHLMKEGAVAGGTSLRFGSPLYMAPEQITGQPQPRSDIYALGVILYQMLAGRAPFAGSTPEGIIYKQVTEPPLPLSTMRPDLPPALGLVVEKALAKKPEERYATAGALLQDFSAALFPTTMPPIRPDGSPKREATASATVPNSPSPKDTPAQPGSAVPSPFAPQPLSIPLPTAAPPMSPSVSSVAPSPAFVIPSKPRISRRTLVLGLGVAGLAVAGGALALLLPSKTPLPPPPTPTPIPLGKLLYIYRGHSDAVGPVAWSPDGKRIASGSNDKTVQIWDAADGGHVFTYRGHSSTVYAVAWSPDGRRIASGSGDFFNLLGDNTVQVWDAANGGSVFTYRGHSNIVDAVAWSPDGRRIASGSRDKTVQVWDAANGGNVYTYRGHSGWVWSVAWSPDGRRIASGGSTDKTVQVWDAAGGGLVYTYRGHSDVVTGVAWSPDGKRIASGSYDKTVQVWDAAGGGLVYTYRGHSNIVTGVTWSPDGRCIASGSTDKTVQVWGAV